MAFDFLDLFKTLAPTAKEIFKSFATKGETDNATWLSKVLTENEHTANEADSLTEEILSTVSRFNTNLRSIEQAAAARQSKEQWLKNFIENSNLTEQQKNEYLAQANLALGRGNQVMLNALQDPNTIDITETVNQLTEQNPPEVNGSKMNRYDRVYLDEQLALQADLIGSQGMMIPAEVSEMPGEEIFQQDLSEESTGSSLDEGLKLAATAVLKISHAAGKIPFLPKNMPVSAITNIACVGVESFKNIGRVVTGKISPLQAIENVGRASVAAIADFCTTGLPAKLLAPIPVVGPALSVAVGAVLTQCSSQDIQEKIHAGINTVKKVAAGVTKTVKKGLATVVTKAKNFASKALNFLTSLF
ncbi:MAG: hypothetical protein IJ685_07160 [Selenomonadaceae bacterium]|nr:hypothetical protein [Selenomonadaceae bacterium]